ncbi:glycoside hydrolase family 27 protein [Pedobacter arcticus]|uniref:glycoside hydrolase family 27 protein n=1 Tax=Pedobacter arcticus TaxID=752140 RepID=UPI0003113C02|nr:glycoside hydrolase family 27 protein [Pedobacter arcticus]
MTKIRLIRTFALILLSGLLPVLQLQAQTAKAPIMGWSSWNNYRIHINEDIIKRQADAMISSGMYKAGYRFVNIDDGFFGGRDSTGKIFADSTKFPSGMKYLADYIHNKNLKAGIYTDAGKNTCGSIYDHDKNGINVGIYGHIEEDCKLYFKEWGYDFLKVDWCGGEKMKLDEETEYTKIINHIKSLDNNYLVNVCRWKFPGTWVINKADSWRISGDISSTFSSILTIIDLNRELYKYASAGHYNDMDMLQVGRGMTYDEDKSHFSMWCILNSPLLAGNDLTKMSKETLEILTNKELIALNQDKGFHQAQRIYHKGEIEIWLKKLGIDGKENAIAILNRGNRTEKFVLTPELIGKKGRVRLRDLWLHKELGKLKQSRSFDIPKHGVVVMKVK